MLSCVAGAPPRLRKIAFTGAPGTGKSSLTAQVARHRLETEGGQVSILAIDPSSRASGGAILGDRIRMDAVIDDPRLFIRSLASRNTGEGLADNIPAIFRVLDEYGFAEVLVETVGVGQVDCASREISDTVVLVVNPNSGDVLQAMKSGILETADILVINKSDLDGVAQTRDALRSAALGRRKNGWDPVLVETTVKEPASIARLIEALDRHRAWCDANVDPAERANALKSYEIAGLVERRCREELRRADPADGAGDIVGRVGRALCALADSGGAAVGEIGKRSSN